MKSINRLIEIGSPALILLPAVKNSFLEFIESSYRDLLIMLKIKNGFYAFESALHVYPIGSTPTEVGLEEWNSEDLWQNRYECLDREGIFFAEDVFGGQFYLSEHGVFVFDPETAELAAMSTDLGSWAQLILEDYDFYTGYSVAHEWQIKNGPLPPGYRLLPKKPFVLGGKYDDSNMYLSPSVEGMRTRAKLANQISDLPDGTRVNLVAGDQQGS